MVALAHTQATWESSQVLLCNSEAVSPECNCSNSEKVTRHLQVFQPDQQRGVGTREKWKGSGEGLLSHRRWKSDPVNSGIPPGLETRALSLCTPWALNECSQMVSGSPAPPEHQAFCMHTYFTLKIAPSFLALLPSGDYRINSSPPGRAMGNPLSSLSLGINNQ